MQNKILVIEDQIEFQKLIEVSLGYKYLIDVAENVSVARNKLKLQEYHLILLDVILPDGSGFDFCREIQADASLKDIPIIFLTSKTSTSDKVFGFSIGVDDYIDKPFDPAELLARVDIRILKAEKRKQNIDSVKKGSLRFEVSGLRLYVEENSFEKQVDVTPIEFKILLKLAQNTNRIFSRQQILDSVWGTNVYIDDRSIDKHISAIRKKIDPYQKYIKTVSGVGYEFKLH
jgi:DNA-binding response OmpR family regulator